MKLSAPIYRLKRQAKLLSRERTIPLNEALNDVARQEGFRTWSLLAARHAQSDPASEILGTLTPGDLVLLGARPGHGKTLLGLELVAKAVKAGKHAAFFTLDFTETDVGERFAALGVDAGTSDTTLTVDTSDEICADYIIDRLRAAPRGTVIVVDYLQLLDQNRSKPVLAEQVSALKSFADRAGVVLVLISQIDRSYDPGAKPVPGLSDVRLPNPVDLTVFTKTIFLNNGDVDLQAVA